MDHSENNEITAAWSNQHLQVSVWVIFSDIMKNANNRIYLDGDSPIKKIIEIQKFPFNDFENSSLIGR